MKQFDRKPTVENCKSELEEVAKEFPEAYEVYKTIVSTPISTTSECDEVENIRAKLISNESKKI